MEFVCIPKLLTRLAGRGFIAFGIAILLVGFTAYLTQAAPLSQSAAEGQTIFSEKCTACHTIGAGVLVGPDLKGVTARRSQDWLTRWISAPDQMLAAKDPIATQLLGQYKNVPMPNLGLSAEEVTSLIDYFTAQDSGKQPAPAPQTKSNLPPGNPAAGKAFFTGLTHLQNNGPACLACHNVVGVGSLGGGALGPDLSGAFTKYGGEVGLANFLATTPTVTMNAVWARQRFTPQEQSDLVAFLQQASLSAPPASVTGLLAGMAFAGMILLLVLAQLYWRKRLVGVRRPLVNRMLRS